MTPDLWQTEIVRGENHPIKPATSGYFPIAPWEPVHAFPSGDWFFTLWKRPLRKVNESLASVPL
jgi:hypothetical protein